MDFLGQLTTESSDEVIIDGTIHFSGGVRIGDMILRAGNEENPIIVPKNVRFTGCVIIDMPEGQAIFGERTDHIDLICDRDIVFNGSVVMPERVIETEYTSASASPLGCSLEEVTGVVDIEEDEELCSLVMMRLKYGLSAMSIRLPCGCLVYAIDPDKRVQAKYKRFIEAESMPMPSQRSECCEALIRPIYENEIDIALLDDESKPEDESRDELKPEDESRDDDIHMSTAFYIVDHRLACPEYKPCHYHV